MGTKTIPREQAEAYGHGMCVAAIEQNGYHDSYFKGIFAVPVGVPCVAHRPEGSNPGPAAVLDVKPGCSDCDCDHYRFTTKETGATAYGGGFIPVEDADEIVLDAYRARRDEIMESLAAERAEREARIPSEGKPVTIVKPPTRGKNKVPAGTTGVVKRRVVNDFDSRYAKEVSGLRSYRVQVETDDKVLWLDEDRVRVTGHEAEDLPISDSQVDYIIAGAWPHR